MIRTALSTLLLVVSLLMQSGQRVVLPAAADVFASAICRVDGQMPTQKAADHGCCWGLCEGAGLIPVDSALVARSWDNAQAVDTPRILSFLDLPAPVARGPPVI